MKRYAALLFAAGASMLVLEACNRDPVRAGEARLDPNGVVLLSVDDGPYKRVEKTKTIHDGDRVKVESGSAGLRVPAGELALREGSELRVGRSPELMAGDVLALPSKSITIDSAGTEAVVLGAARISREFTVTAAAYDGAIVLRSGGATLHVPRLRQATVPAPGQLPRTPSPLQLRDGDSWDRRFLAEAIDLTAELQARSDGATQQYRGEGRTAGFYRTLFPRLEGESQFDQSLLDTARPAGEHIVGAGIALAANPGNRFAERWGQIFDFRAQGAAWGLVAMDQGVSKVPGLVGSIDEALGRTPLPGNSARVSLGAPSVTTTTTTRRAPTTTSSTTTTTADDGGGEDPDPPEPVVTIPDPPPLGLPIDEHLQEVVDELNGLLPKG